MSDPQNDQRPDIAVSDPQNDQRPDIAATVEDALRYLEGGKTAIADMRARMKARTDMLRGLLHTHNEVVSILTPDQVATIEAVVQQRKRRTKAEIAAAAGATDDD